MAAKSKDAHLYGVPRAKRQPNNTASTTAGNLAFSTALSSLIQSSSSTAAGHTSSTPSSQTVPGRQRLSRTKDDIFKTHNRNAKKRAAADMLAYDADVAARYADGAEKMDDTAWKRTKRKMEEKARLYAALKRGDIEDLDEKHMVDFDRKWAEKQEEGDVDSSDDDDTADSEGEDGPATQEIIEFVDEFGRTRRGTRAEAAREARRRNTQAADEPDRFTARPAAPNNLIYGDTIQSAAFNPDNETTTQMEALAAKRDRELTPPEAVHYDANAEIRSRGTGFFQFSKDEDERQEQMQNLEKEREATERAREGAQGSENAREKKLEQRRMEIEERRRIIREKRGKMQADKFLDSLGSELATSIPSAAATAHISGGSSDTVEVGSAFHSGDALVEVSQDENRLQAGKEDLKADE